MNYPSFFEIQADDPTRAAAFYKAAFGWKFTQASEIATVEYWRIETAGGPRGGLLKRPVPIPAMPAGTNAYACSMQVESFDATAAVIAANGGREAMPKFAVPGVCWQGYFLDTEGNVFGLYQPDPAAK